MLMGTLALALLSFAPGADPGDDIVPMNCRNFQIPIKIAEAQRSKIKELILFYSSDQGATWQQAAMATPDKNAFAFYAPTDGLYWFHLCVVDDHGGRVPADIYKTPPRQKILVDTLKPNLRITSAERHGDDIAVSWEIQEDHPDLNTLKLEYRTPDAPSWMWYKAQVSPAMNGQAQFRFASSGSVTVRMQIMDQAGNVGSDQREVQVAGMTPAPAATGAGVVTASVPSNSAPSLPAPQPSAPLTPPAPPLPVSNSVTAAPAPAVPPPALPVMGTNPDRAQAVQQVSTIVTPPADRAWTPASTPAYQQPISSGGDSSGRNAVPSSTVSGAMPGGQPYPQSGSLPALQITNSAQVTLDYVVSKVGPSGVGSVELFLTQDDGQTWQKYADDPDLKPPMTVNLPGEGVYGMKLVVSSRAGLGRRIPKAGEAPQMRLEVDSTPPLAKLLPPQADPRRRDSLILSWSASDRNLAANPVSLQWAENPDGPWQSIGDQLTNSGHYNWQLPSNMPYRVYLRLLVRDTAGNVGIDQTPDAVLIDLQEPEAQLKGLLTVAPAHP
jgi:hypothetical protein